MNVQMELLADKSKPLSSEPPISMKNVNLSPPNIARKNDDGSMTFHYHRKIRDETCRTTIGDVELVLYTARTGDGPPYAMAYIRVPQSAKEGMGAINVWLHAVRPLRQEV